MTIGANPFFLKIYSEKALLKNLHFFFVGKYEVTDFLQFIFKAPIAFGFKMCYICSANNSTIVLMVFSSEKLKLQSAKEFCSLRSLRRACAAYPYNLNLLTTNMKLTHVNSVPLAHGELSVVLSESAENMLTHSTKLASDIRKHGVNTLLINCGVSSNRFNEHVMPLTSTNDWFYKRTNDKEVKLVPYSSNRGDLIGESDTIRQIVSSAGIGVVIIMGWEWTSSTWRRRERLLYFLRELMEEHKVAVIVYSQATTEPTVGMYDRGGIGKLGNMCIAVIKDATSSELEKVAPRPAPIVVTPKEWAEATRSAQLLASKVNGLEGKKTQKAVTNIIPYAPSAMVH